LGDYSTCGSGQSLFSATAGRYARNKQEVAIMDKRTEYVESLSAQMVEWDAQIDLLKNKSNSATPEKKFEYATAIAALQLKLDEAAVKLQGISTASGDEWEELITGSEHVLGEIRTMLRDTITKI
jgi:hypothetical protein